MQFSHSIFAATMVAFCYIFYILYVSLTPVSHIVSGSSRWHSIDPFSPKNKSNEAENSSFLPQAESLGRQRQLIITVVIPIITSGCFLASPLLLFHFTFTS